MIDAIYNHVCKRDSKKQWLLHIKDDLGIESYFVDIDWLFKRFQFDLGHAIAKTLIQNPSLALDPVFKGYITGLIQHRMTLDKLFGKGFSESNKLIYSN